MSLFPVLLEHEVACGVDGRGMQVRASVLNAAATVLVCRGADAILIPAPDRETFAQVSAGIEGVPSQRRSTVRIVDSSGSVLARVRSFIEPLASFATKWPEDAFTRYAEGFVYQVALAKQYQAGIASSSIDVMREFVPIIDPALFLGEARYRLAELIALIAAYEPVEMPHAIVSSTADRAVDLRIDDILESAEFRDVVTASGWIGLVKKPHLAVSRLWRRFRALASNHQAKTTLGLASAVGDVGGMSVVGGVISKLTDLMSKDGKREFAPPFVPLGSAELGIYRMALSSRFPGATPPPGASMSFEYTRGGRRGGSWLNVGEELKLTDEESTAYESHIAAVREVRAVQRRFFQHTSA